MKAERICEWIDTMAEANKWDWHLKLVCGRLSAWSAELRITEKPNRNGPDESRVWYSSGHIGPDEAAQAVYGSLANWQEAELRKAAGVAGG